jgi:hypothetical protein
MKIKKVFNASQFTPTKWDTAQDKADFANRFVSFVAADFPKDGFTQDFYTRLSMTFGHIAHYNQLGFWEEFFTSTTRKIQFLKITMQHPCYGSPDYTYSDVEAAIQAHLGLNWIENYKRKQANEIESSERAEFARLKAKYENKS